MDPILMRAILAMDAYNRGYNPGVTGLVGTQIGGASITQQSDVLPGSPGVNADFYAIAYQLADGSKVISYRGTDASGDFGTDIALWFAQGDTPQLRLALEFYKSVVGAGNDPHAPQNIVLTGHSMGGGLAGYVGALYGQAGSLFDNVAFEGSAQSAYNQSVGPANPALKQIIYGSGTPWAPNYLGRQTYAIDGELAQVAGYRATQTAFQNYFDIGTGVDLGPGPDAVNLHSMSLLVIRLFANGLTDQTSWKASAKYFMPTLFSDDVAIAAGSAGNKGTSDHNEVLRTAIAYSAIDDGTNTTTARPFGDTGIRAMFDDATDFGMALAANASNALMQGAGDAISKIFVQYAGQLAFGKILQTAQASALNGVLTYDQSAGKLTVDLAPAKWADTGVNSAMDIAGRDTLVPDMFTAIKLDNERTSVDSGTFTDDYARTLWNPADKNNITKAVFATTSGATTISETAAPNAKSGAKGGVILVGNTGGDTLEGGDGRDLIAGGDGIDTLKGGKEKDFLFGGANNDTLQGGLGADVMDGGSGIDLADYTDFATGSTLTLGKGDYNNFGLVTFKLTDSATGDIDILFSIEDAKLGVGADTIKIDLTCRVDRGDNQGRWWRCNRPGRRHARFFGVDHGHQIDQHGWHIGGWHFGRRQSCW